MVKHVAIFILFSLFLSEFSSFANSLPQPDTKKQDQQKTPLELENQILAFSKSPQWRGLFFPEKNNLTSRSDSKAFFSTQSRDFHKELEYGLSELQKTTLDSTDESYLCSFPLRTKRIVQHFKALIPNLAIHEKKLADINFCPKLRAWQTRVPAKSASLIFSSYYLGNPSSTFGHTLLRLNQDENPTQKDLLDNGINFGANATTDNPLFYAIGGMFGAFPSSFIALPYYYKVREYNDYEARDLWEYHLNLTQDEVSDVVLALWEQKDNYYDYYFLTENCGYYILALLEAAAPRYELTKHTRKWVVPVDTLVIAENQGLIKKSFYRPSLRTQLDTRLNSLSKEDSRIFNLTHDEVKSIQVSTREQAERSVTNLSVFKIADKEKQAQVLDAILDQYDIDNKELYLEKDRSKPSPAAMLKKEMLFTRATLPASKPLEIPHPEDRNPIYSHGSFRWGLGYLQENFNNHQSHLALLPIRMAYHDFLDEEKGSPLGAQIQIFNMEFSAGQHQNKFTANLENFILTEITSIPYFKNKNWTPSWSIMVGADKATDIFSERDFRPHLKMAYGIGPLLMAFNYEYSVLFPHDSYLLQIGPQMRWLFRHTNKWKSYLQLDMPLWAGNSKTVDHPVDLAKIQWTHRLHVNSQKHFEVGIEGQKDYWGLSLKTYFYSF